ncbi:MAG: cysteine methyltransferase [Oscillospiraceae bacterium]|nr:cysteine methyltransferase [Oscillospiraceae bacterium]
MNLILFDTPFGRMGLSEEDGMITNLYLPNTQPPRIPTRETQLLRDARLQLFEYFGRFRQNFDLPLAPNGTIFYQRVWDALQEIPYGETRSYRDIADAAGSSGGFRAAGQAARHNPIPIIIPCHRVINSNGSLGGYAGGTPLKELFLALEQGKKRT